MRGSENLLPLADALAGVVREAGGLARAASGSPVKTWVKEHNSPVSEVDIAVNQLLKERLARLSPKQVGCRRKAKMGQRDLQRRGSGSSTRSTGHVPSSLVVRIGRFRSHWWKG